MMNKLKNAHIYLNLFSDIMLIEETMHNKAFSAQSQINMRIKLIKGKENEILHVKKQLSLCNAISLQTHEELLYISINRFYLFIQSDFSSLTTLLVLIDVGNIILR